MEPAIPAAPRRDTLNLRIRPADRGMIDRAAALTGKTRTDFVLDAARQAAEDALINRILFAVPPTVLAEFQARLDAPAETSEPLRRTMQARPPWET